MFSLHCHFCEHGNRAGAKFCEECGSALNLKLCKQCEAINHRAAQHCHQCGTEFPAEWTPDQVTVTENAHGRLADEAGGVIELVAEVAARQPDSPAANAPFLVPRPQLAYDAVLSRSKWSTKQGRSSRAVVSALLLATTAGLAYYLYRLPEQTTLTPTASRPTAGAPVQASSVDIPTPSMPVTVGASALESLTQPVAEANGVVAPVAARSDARAVRSDARRVSDARSDVKQTAATRPPTRSPSAAARVAMQPPPGEPSVNVRLDQSNGGTCTEAVAALGLCSPSAKREDN